MARRSRQAVTWPSSVRRPTAPVSPFPSSAEDTVDVARLLLQATEKEKLLFGTMVEDLLRSPTGDLVVRTIHNMKAVALRQAKPEQAERQLGRMEGYEHVLEVLEQYVAQAWAIKTRQQEDRDVAALEREMDGLGTRRPVSPGAGERE